jgi:transposase
MTTEPAVLEREFPWAELERLRAQNLYEESDEVAGLTRDLRLAAAQLGRHEGRYLVDMYYQLQEHRLAANNQVRSMEKAGEPTTVLQHFATQMAKLEGQAKSALNVWVKNQGPLGEWLLGIVGIGPVLAAGLLANVEHHGQTAGELWSLCGLDPTTTWARARSGRGTRG